MLVAGVNDFIIVVLANSYIQFTYNWQALIESELFVFAKKLIAKASASQLFRLLSSRKRRIPQ